MAKGKEMKLNAQDLKWYGRHFDFQGRRYFDYSNSGFEFCFTGKKAVCKIQSDPENWGETNRGVLAVYVTELNESTEYKGSSFWENFPEELDKKIILENKENECVLYESDVEKTVLIRVLKISEVNFGYAGFEELEIDGRQITASAPSNNEAVKIEIIGDSITCGYGIEGTWNVDAFTTKQERSDKAYAFLTAKNLGAEFRCVSWSGIGVISQYIDPSVDIPNVDVSMPLIWPYTDKSASLRLGIEPEVQPDDFDADIVVIHLGTNDASFVRGKEDRRLLYVHNLRVLMESVHQKYQHAKICCCLGAMGQDLCDSVNQAVNLFSKNFPNVPVKAVKFPVQDEKDGIASDWHPSAITHQKIAAQLTEELKNW